MKIGFGLGSLVALFISLNHDNGFFWALFHSFFSWLYVGYSWFAY